jgi:hypothetical protein
MGWGRTLLLGDIGNRLDIGDTERDISDLSARLAENTREDATQDDRLVALEEDNRDLKLCVAALARVLVARGVIDADDLTCLAGVIDPDQDEQAP